MSSKETPYYIDVILPVPVGNRFTYSVPEDFSNKIKVGCRVIVPFGPRKLTGVVQNVNIKPQPGINIRAISRLVDAEPLFGTNIIKLWKWISFYYMAPLGDVQKAALSGKIDIWNENRVWLSKQKAPKNIQVKWAENPNKEAFIEKVGKAISRAVKQRELVEQFKLLANENEISKKKLLEETGIASHVLSALVGKGIFEEVEEPMLKSLSVPTKLTDDQKVALDQIRLGFEKRNTQLLHGVTASGKTEIYIHLIEESLLKKKQVLYLVPEIALTNQLVNRLVKVFGDKVLAYHSKITDAQRSLIWTKVLNNEPLIILGARSSVFVPFTMLDLVIVDEEHEASYKQVEPSPRYNGRDAAIYLASLFGAKVLLGTATPSVQSFYNAETDKYGYVKLEKRFFESAELPSISIEDLNDCYKKNKIKKHFSFYLIGEIRKALENKQQVVLFQNRRGYAVFIECKACGHVPTCPHCNVSLTFHAKEKALVCHYCGHRESPMLRCPKCADPSILPKGAGTEKIVEEVQELFPEAKISRIDFDISKRKNAVEEHIADFENQDVDILIGTQMIVKGIDFKNVGLVGVLNTDQLINHPEYWAGERSLQMLTQVAGRAGRRGQGRVVLQSHNPDHPVLLSIRDYQYQTWLNEELKERELFNYPPFSRIITVQLRGKLETHIEAFANEYANMLRPYFKNGLLGPEKPAVDKIQQNFIRKILIKSPKNVALADIRNVLYKCMSQLKSNPGNSGIQLVFDVDPA